MANNPFDSQKYQNFLNWFKDCKSNPYNQNTYLFGEGLSYYEQLSLIGSFLYDLKEYITTSDWTTGEELQAIIDQIEAEKQNVLISGENIKTINSESILSAGNLDLQEKLIAGQNIVISPDGKTISASGTVGIDYPNVSNKPQINGHTLQSGNNTLDTLGIQAKDDTILFQSDVIDNLNSEDTNFPLSANQGKVLDEKKQDVLVSGSDIKTLNEIPLLGEGNITLKTLNGQSLIGSENIPIKTVGSESIFGSGNIAFKTINSQSLMDEGNMTLMDLVENAVNNHVLLTDSNGQAIDSGVLISALQNNLNIINLGTIANLNLSSLQANQVYFGYTNSGTLNKPDTAAAGFLITVTSNVSQSGRQYYMSDIGIFTRRLDNNTYYAWIPLINKKAQWQTAILNPTYFSSGACRYFKQGNIVIANISDAILKENIPSGTVNDIFTGLPKSLNDFIFLAHRFQSDESWRLILLPNGTIRSQYDAQTAGAAQWYANFTYLCTDDEQ